MSNKERIVYKRNDNIPGQKCINTRFFKNKVSYDYISSGSCHEEKSKHPIQVNLVELQTSAIEHVPFYIIADNWLLHLKPCVKETTFIKYKNLLKTYIIPYIGNFFLDEITNKVIDSYCRQMMKKGGCLNKGLSPKTVSDILSLIRNILRYASDSGYLTLTDAKSITIKLPAKEMKVLSLSEQAVLCNYIYKNPSLINIGILISLFTGIRVGELCALKWEDISLPDKTIYIHHTMQRIQTDNDKRCKTKITITTPKSLRSVRTIPLPDELIQIITNFQNSPQSFFLTGRDNKWIEPRTMQNHLKKLLKINSIEKINYHCLRHTFATRCVELGFDIKSLSEILGHANVNITMNRYVHPTMELKRTNMQKFSSLLTVKEHAFF